MTTSCFVEGVASLLERSGFEVVGQAGDEADLLALVRATRPDVAIVDIRMPPAFATEGLRVARVIREELPNTAIVVLSAHVEVDEAMELLATGERLGYLLKSRVTDVAEFIDTVRRISAAPASSTPRWCKSWCAPEGGAIRSTRSRHASWRS